jgi:hypothetical protein
MGDGGGMDRGGVGGGRKTMKEAKWVFMLSIHSASQERRGQFSWLLEVYEMSKGLHHLWQASYLF